MNPSLFIAPTPTMPMFDDSTAPWLDAVSDQDLPALNAYLATVPPPLIPNHPVSGSPLLMATYDLWLDGVQALLPRSDPKALDEQGCSALFIAVHHSHGNEKKRIAMARLLIPVSDLAQADEEGRTVLSAAVERQSLPLVKLLLAAGANPQQKSRETPLIQETSMINDRMFDLLLPLMEPHATDRHGYNALLSLLYSGYDPDQTIVDRWVKFCAHGHDPYQNNDEGTCAMDKLKSMPNGLERRVLKAMADHENTVLQKVAAEPLVAAVDLRSRL